MIRNYQKSSGGTADLSPIYSSLQTINAFLYQLDVQTTFSRAINSLSSSYNSLSSSYNLLSNSIWSLEQEVMANTTINNAIQNLSDSIWSLEQEVYANTTINTAVYELSTQNESQHDAISNISKSYTSLTIDNRLIRSQLNNLGSSFDSFSESITSTINAITGSITDLSDRISTMTGGGGAVTVSGMNFITDTVLTKNITDYNTYYNTNLEIFEPYVQYITNYAYISTSYPNQRFNLPNATLITPLVTTIPRQLNNCTLDMVYNGIYMLSYCSVNILTDFVGGCLNCSVKSFYASNTFMIQGGFVNNLSATSVNQGILVYANISGATIKNCDVESCKIGYVDATSCQFNQCTIDPIPTQNNSFVSMTLIPPQTRFYNCGITDCLITGEKTTGYYSECTLENVSIPNLNNTSFLQCTGTVFIPKVVNGTVLFNDLGNYLYPQGTYYKTYTQFSSFTDISNSETVTVEATNTLTTTMNPQLNFSILPGYDYTLPPTQVVIAPDHKSMYIDIDYIRNRNTRINISGCTGNLNLQVNTVDYFTMEDNSLKNAYIDITFYTDFTFSYNTISNCTINTYENNLRDVNFRLNEITNLVVNNYAYQTDMSFESNTFSKAKFLAFTEDVTCLHIYDNYLSATFEGSHEFTECTLGNIVIDGTCNFRDCVIGRGLLNGQISLQDCTIQQLIVNPGEPNNQYMEYNSIETYIAPDFMSETGNYNTINTIITY